MGLGFSRPVLKLTKPQQRARISKKAQNQIPIITQKNTAGRSKEAPNSKPAFGLRIRNFSGYVTAPHGAWFCSDERRFDAIGPCVWHFRGDHP